MSLSATPLKVYTTTPWARGAAADACGQHALTHGHGNVKLSKVRAYATQYGITVPAVDVMGADAEAEDAAALTRYRANIGRYFKINVS